MPQHPPYPPPPPPPTGWVALTLQGSMLTSSMIPPRVWMNGQQVPTSYGPNLIPVHPGRLRIDVRCQWLREFGQAELDLVVAPGQTVPVFYAAPLHQFSRGRIGHEKQSRPGKVGLLVILPLLVVLPIASVVLGLAAR